MRNILRNKYNFIIVSIIFFAAFLRLYKIQDYMTFLGDEGRDVLVAYNILHGHLTLLGPTASVGGFYFGPIYYYFMAPFLLAFNYNPVGPAIMVALFGIATVYLVYKIGNEFFNRATGIIAALLYAISPVIIAYSRSSWNPNPLPFFSLLTIYFTYLAFKRDQKKIFIFSGISLGIAMELHFISLILAAVVFIYVLTENILERKKKTGKSIFSLLIKEYGAIFFGFLIGWLPYLAFEVRHGFQNIRNFFSFIFFSGKVSSNSNYFVTLGNSFFKLFGRFVTNFPPPDQASFKDFYIVLWFYATLLLGFISITLFFFLLYQKYKKKDISAIRKCSMVALWFVISLLAFGFYKKQIYDYYFSFLYPIPFFLASNMITTFWKKGYILKTIAGITLGFLIFVNLQGIPFRYPPNKQLLQTETISRFVLDKTQGKPFNFALITGGNSDHAYRYFFTIWHHPPVTIENATNDPQRKTVTDQLLIVCESLPCQPLGNSLFEVAGFGRGDIIGHWPVSVVEVYRLIHYKGK